jgi:hypothetical protein
MTNERTLTTNSHPPERCFGLPKFLCKGVRLFSCTLVFGSMIAVLAPLAEAQFVMVRPPPMVRPTPLPHSIRPFEPGVKSLDPFQPLLEDYSGTNLKAERRLGTISPQPIVPPSLDFNTLSRNNIDVGSRMLEEVRKQLKIDEMRTEMSR